MLARILLLILGLGCSGVGILYLAKPDTIFKINAYCRDIIFNDAFVSLRRKQIGSFLILLGLVLLTYIL